MHHFYRGPVPLHRSLIGLLLLCLARRMIPAGFSDLPSSCANDPLAEPVTQAHPCQGNRLPNQGVVLWQETDAEG